MITFNNVEESTNGKIGRKNSDVAIIGCPFDLASTRTSGQREGPEVIRSIDTWANDDSAKSILYDVDPFEVLEVVDTGDVEFNVGDLRGGWQAILDHVIKVYANTKAVLLMGGDHSIAAKAIEGISKKEGQLTVIHFDAHPDYWKPDPGMEMDHGTWVRAVLDRGFADRVIQFGVRGWGLSDVDRTWGLKNDVTTYGANTQGVMQKLIEELNDTANPVYLSVDIDVLDPAFCPGVAFPEPGGYTSRELLSMINVVCQSGKVVGMDVTELIPQRDHADVTAKIANRIVMQMLTGTAMAKVSSAK